jgi:hypothetical protein
MLYVGSHKGSVDDGYVCSSRHMLKEYNERPEDFSRHIIAEGNLSDIRKLEAKILQAANARLDESFYNKHDNDGFYFDGWKKGEMTLEHRQKMSEAKKGKKLSESHRKNILNNRVGKKNSAEHTAALVASRIGSNHSEESKRKMSEEKKKNPVTKEIASAAGKISAIKRKESGYYQTPEYKEKCKLAWEKRRANKLAKHTGGIR